MSGREVACVHNDIEILFEDFVLFDCRTVTSNKVAEYLNCYQMG